MDDKLQVLLIEDDPDDVFLVKDALARADRGRVRVVHASRLLAGLDLIGLEQPDVVLLDLNLPDSSGLETLSALNATAPQVPIVVLSGLADSATTLEAIRRGAQDYLLKGEISGPLLHRVLCYAIERKRAQEALQSSERLLLALSQAAQAVQRARSPEEVYAVVGNEVVGLGYQAAVFTLTDDRASLALRHVTIDPDLVHAAERIAGTTAQSWRIEIAPGSLPEQIVRAGRTVFCERVTDPLAEALNSASVPVAEQVVETLGLEQAILAPLRMQDEIHGLLVITGLGLTQADVPAVAAFANQAAIAIENAQLLETVDQHRAELESLSARLITAQEAERQRIARELHDEMGQALTAIAINLAALKKSLSPAATLEDKDRLAETSALVAQTLEQMRELSLDLRPSLLDELGLVPTVRWYARRWAERLNIEIDLEALNVDETLSGEVATGLYRIVQEALTNVARHAKASRVRICLEREPARITALIEDDGRGFDPAELLGRQGPDRGMGLLGMRERVTALGGRFDIGSRPGQGTRLTVEIPLPSGRMKNEDHASDVYNSSL